MENQEKKQIFQREEEIEIDLAEVFYHLKKKVWLVIAVTLLCGNVAGVFARTFLQPVYTSSALMLVLTKETTLSSLADLQIGSQLTNDYRVLIESRPVLQDVIDNLGLEEVGYKELRKQLTVENPDDTRILEISVEDHDPVTAKEIVDEIAKVSSSYIGDQMEVTPPKVIEKGEIPTEKTSPSIPKFILIGMALGLAAMLCAIVVQTMLNDSIQSEEDVQKYLGLTALAVVPDKALESSSSRKKKKRR